MIELDILKYLDKELDVDVYLERPENAPDEFVIIEKTAGGMVNFVENVTLAIQSYSASLVSVIKLNEAIKNAMLNAPTLEKVGMCRLNSDYNFTDSNTKEYRYQAVYNLTYK